MVATFKIIGEEKSECFSYRGNTLTIDAFMKHSMINSCKGGCLTEWDYENCILIVAGETSIFSV